MIYCNYNTLLKPSSLENFTESLDLPNGYIFNSLVNIFVDEEVNYETIEGFNKSTKDKDIKLFNKISFRFNDLKEIDKIIKEYELMDVFNIEKNKNIYTFIVIEE